MTEHPSVSGFQQPRAGYEFLELAPCKGCGRQIAWWRTYPNEKRSPHDPDGTSHFATCPDADRFRARPPRSRA